MAAMKFYGGVSFLLFVAVPTGISAAIHTPKEPHPLDVHTHGPDAAPEALDSKHDVAACMEVAAKFIKSPADAITVSQNAAAYCQGKHGTACDHLKEVLLRAFEREHADTVYTPEEFCKVSEAYVADLHGAVRVPSVGKGSLTNFKVAASCTQTVAAAMLPAHDLASEHLAEFWYSMCLNQDCAHFLQSRTRWCEVSRAPTHSVAVCDGVRRFIADEITVHEKAKMDPKQACDLYAEYVKEMAEDVQSYNIVLHQSSADPPPAPTKSGAPQAAGMRSVVFIALAFAVSVVAAV